jgi:hypothetical protein
MWFWVLLVLAWLLVIGISIRNRNESPSSSSSYNKQTSCNKQVPINYARPQNKIVCYYTYYEKDEVYKKNLEFFLTNGINDLIDYIFVINGECSVPIEETSHVKVLKRENTGFDFGAYSYGIKNTEKTYEYYFFINSSVRGPYIKGYSNWQDEFINLIKDDIKLVGTTINIKPYVLGSTHVQSMMFAMDYECFDFLKESIFKEDEIINNKLDVILQKEVKMSEIVLANNWNISYS